MLTNIGIIGQGFVGTALREVLRETFSVYCYDKKHGAAAFNKNEEIAGGEGVSWVVANTSGPIFVCLPTPMSPDGNCDTSIVDETVRCLDELASAGKTRRVLILKSTVPPGTTERLNKCSQFLSVCFNPEFLREASPVEDMRQQNRIVLGGPGEAVTVAAEMYQRAFPKVPIVTTSSTVAEMVKYVTNAFLSVKVSFANEINDICAKLGIDYDEVIDAAALDTRLGTSHWRVPGPDGKRGFGGSCFPKDLNALMALAESLSALHHTMRGAWTTNLAVRPERDWEQLHGRAVNYK